MSTRHPNLLPKRRSAAPTAGKENADINIITKKKRSRTQKDKQIIEKIDETSTKSCETTPKSEANKIPQALTCPAAPKKPMRKVAVMSCKRKLMSEFEFFETERRKEVDEFFRSSFERLSNVSDKRRNVVVSTDAIAGDDNQPSSSSSSSPAPP